MKNLLMHVGATFFAGLVSSYSFSQDSLQYFNHHRNQLVQQGMQVLGVWGGAAAGSGIAGWAFGKGNNKYFGMMNTFWGATDLSLALFAKHRVNKQLQKNYPLAESLKEQQKTEKIFFINTLLDLGYAGVGSYLKVRGNTHNNARLKGYGSSVIFTGAFSFAFDGIMYKLQHSNGKALRRYAAKHV